MHANMESTGLPDASFDLVAVQFVAHECPGRAIEGLVSETPAADRPRRWASCDVRGGGGAGVWPSPWGMHASS